MVGLQRKKTIRSFFKDEGFPSRVSLVSAKRDGFETLNDFWEHYNNEYEKSMSEQRDDKKPEKYQKKKEYNKERNRGIREKGKTFTVHPSEFLKDPKYFQEAPKFENMKSTQRDVNATRKALANKIKEMTDKGRVKIEGNPNQIFEALDNLQGKLHVSYITKDGLYRSGGFLRSGKDDASKNQMKKDGYITLFIPDKKLSFPVQMKNVQTLYVLTVETDYELKETEQPPTKYPVEIGGIIVYYARDSYAKKRFMASKKYSALMKKVTPP